MKFQELVLWLVVWYHQLIERRARARFTRDLDKWIAEMSAGECE